MKVKDLPLLDRPREKMRMVGAQNLSTSELLAIILRTGTKEKSVMEVSYELLSVVGDISNLENTTMEKLCKIKGIGKDKATNILAAIEIGKRIFLEREDSTVILDNTESIFNYSKYFFHGKKQEHFYCLYLDEKKHLIASKLLFIGTINRSIVHPREVFKEAYLLSASAIICIHNHPSGIVWPSPKDVEFTQDLIKIGNIQGIPILDHLIVSEHNYYSFEQAKNRYQLQK